MPPVGNSESFRQFARATLFGLLFVMGAQMNAAEAFQILKPDNFRHYIDRFNAMEPEKITNFVSNAESFAWLQRNIPFFECPDVNFEEIYYFRWWSFRKHLVQTTNGFIMTEFMAPVKHAGIFNTISCAAAFHVAEGRWLRNRGYLDDYVTFWFKGNGGKPQPHLHRYSTWLPAAVYDRFLVDGNTAFVTHLLDGLAADCQAWEQERGLSNGLYWQFDVWDGMEESISGSRTIRNIRPTINSYMFANMRAIAEIARLAGEPERAAQFEKKSAELRESVQKALWNPEANFFEALKPNGSFSDVREELGFIPWCFNLPSAGCESAWSQFTDTNGFKAPYGITTAERRHPAFRSHGCCKCEWDGAVWPFATCQTLWALGNVLRDYSQSVVTKRDYFDAFRTYVRCQYREGKPFIGEYLDEKNGQWLRFEPGRSYYYNHSTFGDLVIAGLVGLRPRADDTIEINPLLPAGTWKWFCLDGIRYHDRLLTIAWDEKGDRYGKRAGFTVMVDGNVIAHSPKLGKLTAKL